MRLSFAGVRAAPERPSGTVEARHEKQRIHLSADFAANPPLERPLLAHGPNRLLAPADHRRSLFWNDVAEAGRSGRSRPGTTGAPHTGRDNRRLGTAGTQTGP